MSGSLPPPGRGAKAGFRAACGEPTERSRLASRDAVRSWAGEGVECRRHNYDELPTRPTAFRWQAFQFRLRPSRGLRALQTQPAGVQWRQSPARPARCGRKCRPALRSDCPPATALASAVAFARRETVRRDCSSSGLTDPPLRRVEKLPALPAVATVKQFRRVSLGACRAFPAIPVVCQLGQWRQLKRVPTA